MRILYDIESLFTPDIVEFLFDGICRMSAGFPIIILTPININS